MTFTAYDDDGKRLGTVEVPDVSLDRWNQTRVIALEEAQKLFGECYILPGLRGAEDDAPHA